MTPVIDLPPTLQPKTTSVVMVVKWERSPVGSPYTGSDPIGEPDFPNGIDYSRWSTAVRPSPRSAFADRLDVLDLFED